MKAICLCGGLGTRMLPATNCTNKHLLPVYTVQGAIPMLFYPIYTLVRSGIKEILIVSSREHSGPIIEYLGDGERFDADFTYKIQDVSETKPLGIASALKLAEGFVQHERFAVILGDNFFSQEFAEEFKEFNENNSQETDKPMDAMVFLSQVKDPHRFGVAYEENGKLYIEEKPTHPKSNMAVTGLYVYNHEVFTVAQTLNPSNRGELEITDINNHFCNLGTISAKTITGFWSDMGVPQSMINTEDFIQENNFQIDLPILKKKNKH